MNAKEFAESYPGRLRAARFVGAAAADDATERFALLELDHRRPAREAPPIPDDAAERFALLELDTPPQRRP